VLAVEFVESYFDAWNHRDAQSVADHLSKDGKYFDIPDQTLLTHDELVKTLADSFYHENNHYELVGEIVTGENTVAFQYKVSSANPDVDEGIRAPWFGAEFIVLDVIPPLELMIIMRYPAMSKPITQTQGSRSMQSRD